MNGKNVLFVANLSVFFFELRLVGHTLPVIPDQSRKRPRGVLPLGLFLPSIVPDSIIPMRCLWQPMFLVGIRTHALFTKQPRPIRFVSPVTAFVEHVCGFVAKAAINADNAQEITATPPLKQTVHFTPPCVFGDVKTISGNCQPYNLDILKFLNFYLTDLLIIQMIMRRKDRANATR